MVETITLQAGEYPPDGEDFALVSIAANGKVQVIARDGGVGFRSASYLDGDLATAAARGMETGREWAEELGLDRMYVECDLPGGHDHEPRN